MTYGEAKTILTLHLMECGMLMPIEWIDSHNDPNCDLWKAMKLAIDLLEKEEKKGK